MNNDLATQLANAERPSSGSLILHPFRFSSEMQNQFVFFFKPEVFLVRDTDQRRGIIELAFDKLSAFGVSIAGCVLLSGSFLEDASVMNRHYGYINSMSRQASRELSAEDAEAVRAASGAQDATRIIGGHEYLRESGITASELDSRWQEKPSVKVRSGLYVQQMELDDQKVVVVNGFHPAQLAHFTASNRMIAVMLIESDLPWSIVRTLMIGDTFPSKGAQGSIRRELHDSAPELGLGTVDITNNCVHLSAGPFESYFEMANFLSTVHADGFEPQLPVVAQHLKNVGLESHVNVVRDNPTCQYGSLFDLTEGVDTRSGVQLYDQFFT